MQILQSVKSGYLVFGLMIAHNYIYQYAGQFIDEEPFIVALPSYTIWAKYIWLL